MGKDSSSSLSDKDFFEAFESNEKVLIQEFYVKNFEFVKLFVLKKFKQLSLNDIEDIYQDGVISMWRNIQEKTFEYRPDVKLTTYLITLCKYKILDKLKSKEFGNLSLQELNIDWDSGYEEHYQEESILSRQLSKALNALGKRCKAILELFYYEKKNLQEIAAETNISESSIRNEKYRCMQSLRENFLSIQKSTKNG